MTSRLLVVLIAAIIAMYALQGAKWFGDEAALNSCLETHSRGVCFAALYP